MAKRIAPGTHQEGTVTDQPNTAVDRLTAFGDPNCRTWDEAYLDNQATLASDIRSLLASHAALVEAGVRVRARCQNMRFDPDAANALDALDAALNSARGG